MNSFPSMVDVPPVLSTKGWQWRQIKHPCHPSNGHWIGTDREGHRWLTKLRGAFYAYREIVFGKLAEQMGWSCQTSTYIRLDPASVATLGVSNGTIHAAHWYLDEHGPKPCSPSCPMRALAEVRSLEDLEGVAVAHLMDWPKSEFAAYIFGANEVSDRLFTATHEFVIIDSEQMFATGPCSFETAFWVRPDIVASQRAKGFELAATTCADVSRLSPTQVAEALKVPRGVSIHRRWPIAPKIKQSVNFASQYVRDHPRRSS